MALKFKRKSDPFQSPDKDQINTTRSMPGRIIPSLKERYYTFISFPRRKLYSILANVNYRTTRTHVRLQQLPIELLIEIATLLEPPDAVCLGLTSQLLWAVVQISLKTTSDLSLSVRQEIKLDHKHVKDLFCGHCQVRHGRSSFSCEQSVSHGPRAPVCWGAEGRFILCGDISYRFLELQREIHDWGEIVASSQNDLRLNHTGLTYARLKRDYRSRHCVSTVVYDLGISYWWIWKETFPFEAFRGAISNLDRPICPHLHTGDMVVWEKLLKKVHDTTIKNGPQLDSALYDMSSPACNPLLPLLESDCPEPHCFTTFELTRNIQGYLHLHIARDIGSLDSVMDPAWCSQIVRVD